MRVLCRFACCQVSRTSADAASLLGRVYLVNTGQDTWVGGYRTGSVAVTGWSWVDDTDATNLNCGSMGCGPWVTGQPSGGVEDRAHIWTTSSSGLNDRPDTFLQPYTCEIEVCNSGRFLGPSFTTGCLQCPPGSYSVGGAVGGCTLCPRGTFGNSSGLSSPACSGNCTAPGGSACPPGSTNATGTPCAAGTWSAGGTSNCTLCPVGRYSLSGWSACVDCPAGRFGGTAGLPSASCTGNCSAGYACPAGSSNSTAVLCGAGQYSVSGSGSCTSCPASAPFASAGSVGSGSCYTACPDATWTAWVDVAGVEGAHSCFKRVAANVAWSTANASCMSLGGGSHLLTSRQVVVD
jgi:hypothetical protein